MPAFATVTEALRAALARSQQVGVSFGEISRRTGVPVPVLSRFAAETRQELALSTVDKLVRHFGATIQLPFSAVKSSQDTLRAQLRVWLTANPEKLRPWHTTFLEGKPLRLYRACELAEAIGADSAPFRDPKEQPKAGPKRRR